MKLNWHLDKRISVGHLVTTGTLLLGIVLWGARMETRITVAEVGQQVAKEQVSQVYMALDSRMIQQEKTLYRIEEKLDRSIMGRSPGVN